jgi:hypothetical protein
MSQSTTRPQSVKKEMSTSGRRNDTNKEKEKRDKEKEKRDKKLTADIDAIWEEVSKDVDELSKPPPEKEVQKKWKAGRVFGDWLAGRKKPKQDQAEKRDDNSTEKIADPTPEILRIMQNVTPGLAPNRSKVHEKFRTALTNTIQCINILGKTVAGSASQVSSILLLKDP